MSEVAEIIAGHYELTAHLKTGFAINEKLLFQFVIKNQGNC
jgi:hypothetical protein